MLKRETTKNRLNRMLNVEQEELNEATRAAAIADFSHLAREYFETDGATLQMKKGKNGTDVLVSFKATRVKNFTVLK